MNRKQKKQEHMQNINRFAIKFLLAFNLAGILGGIIQVFRGKHTIVFPIILAMIAAIFVSIILLEYKKNPVSKKIQYIYVCSVQVMYIAIAIGINLPIIYSIIFPASTFIILYTNRKIVMLQGIGCFIGTAICILKQIISGNTESIPTSIIILVLFTYAIAFVNKRMRILHYEIDTTVDETESQKAKLENIVAELQQISGIVKLNSEELKDIVRAFGESTVTVNKSIEDISKGAKETAGRISDESMLIDIIKEKIDNTSSSTDKVSSYSEKAAEAVEIGIKAVNLLAKKSENINTKNAEVSNTMRELVKKSSNIATITGVITEIADRTNLLALNAAIEAARAGEAGKGFAVVAEEITKLAEESKNNANNIDAILKELEVETNDSVTKVEELVKETKEQEVLVKNTDESFNNIIEVISIVKEEILNVSAQMTDILQSSEKIQESIITLSAISEETLASTEETNTISFNNFEKIQNLENISDKINDSISDLDKYFE